MTCLTQWEAPGLSCKHALGPGSGPLGPSGSLRSVGAEERTLQGTHTDPKGRRAIGWGRAGGPITPLGSQCPKIGALPRGH